MDGKVGEGFPNGAKIFFSNLILREIIIATGDVYHPLYFRQSPTSFANLSNNNNSAPVFDPDNSMPINTTIRSPLFPIGSAMSNRPRFRIKRNTEIQNSRGGIPFGMRDSFQY